MERSHRITTASLESMGIPSHGTPALFEKVTDRRNLFAVGSVQARKMSESRPQISPRFKHE
jgi:hypothetical protein